MPLSKKINLRENESIELIIRPSHLNYFWSYLLALLILFSTAFFAFWLILQNWFGIAVLFFSTLASFGLVVRARFRINRNYWVITDERLIDVEKHGFLKETISSIEFNQITDAQIKRGGFKSALFGLGNLIVDAGNEDFAISINGIKDPQIMLDNIIKIMENSSKRKVFSESKSIIKVLYKILPTLTVDEIQEIINRLKNRLIEYKEEID